MPRVPTKTKRKVTKKPATKRIANEAKPKKVVRVTPEEDEEEVGT